MSSKPKIALTARILLVLAILVAGLWVLLYFSLPPYLKSRVIPQILAEAGISEYGFKVRHIGLFGADLGVLRIGPEQKPALLIQSVQVDYSPQGLYRKRIERITLSGIELYGEIVNGQFKLRGVDIEKILMGAQPQDSSVPASNNTSPLVFLERLAINNSRINLAYDAQYYRLPFEFDILPRDSDFNRLEVIANLYPRGAKITASVNLNRSMRRAELNFESEILELGHFTDITSRVADIMMSGELTLQGRAHAQWAPLQISAVNASLLLQRGKINAGALKIQNAVDSQGREIPIRVDLLQKNDNGWQISGSRISMLAPTPLTLSGFNGEVIRKTETFAGTGNFTLALHQSARKGQISLPLKIQDPLELRSQFSVQYHKSGQWHCEISNNPPDDASGPDVHLSIERYKIASSIPQFLLSAESDSQIIHATYKLIVPGVRIASGSESVQIPRATVNGAVQLTRGADPAFGATFDLRTPNTSIKLEGAKIKISNMSLSGKLNRNTNRLITLESMMQLSGAGGFFPNLNASFSGVRGKIPFKWPAAGKGAKGSVSIANLKLNGMNLGGIKSSIRQTPTGFAIEGRHQSTLFPRMTLAFAGETRLFHSGPAQTRIHVDLSRPIDGPDIELEKFIPVPAGMRLNGKLLLNGDLTLNSGGFSGMVRLDFANGRLLMDKNKFALEGIRVSLDFPELPRIRSAPGQQIQFAKISLGDIVFKNGKIDFQIESARSFLIEKMNFTWCEGKVETQSIRISPGVEDYRLIFYCDRLKLAQVLEQFGAAAAKGDGTVNGRIPLQYTNGKIRFDDGFLFSTPGQGGKIYLKGADILTAGMTPNTPQYVQMELAREALKDYDYSWAKLNITSEGEELLLQMQMDGKPANVLPFVYRKDIGGFIKVEAGGKGSKFQGIRLDVNFRLPLNKLLQYKDLIEMIK